MYTVTIKDHRYKNGTSTSSYLSKSTAISRAKSLWRIDWVEEVSVADSNGNIVWQRPRNPVDVYLGLAVFVVVCVLLGVTFI